MKSTILVLALFAATQAAALLDCGCPACLGVDVPMACGAEAAPPERESCCSGETPAQDSGEECPCTHLGALDNPTSAEPSAQMDFPVAVSVEPRGARVPDLAPEGTRTSRDLPHRTQHKLHLLLCTFLC